MGPKPNMTGNRRDKAKKAEAEMRVILPQAKDGLGTPGVGRSKEEFFPRIFRRLTALLTL